jgi:hypothetical protein
LRWLLYRDLAVESQEAQQIIVWVRSDAFPGGLEALPAPIAPSQDSGVEEE